MPLIKRFAANERCIAVTLQSRSKQTLHLIGVHGFADGRVEDTLSSCQDIVNRCRGHEKGQVVLVGDFNINFACKLEPLVFAVSYTHLTLPTILLV